VLRYLKGIAHYGLRYVGEGELVLHGIVGFDWAGDVNVRKITSGLFQLGLMYDFLVQQEASHSCTQLIRVRVYGG
jgi:hypothetical protein